MANEIMVQNNNIALGTILINTISGDDIEARVEAGNAMTDADSLREVGLDTPISVRNFITRAGVRSRTGEACIDVFIICDDGHVYYTQSSGIANSVLIYVAAFTDANGHFTAPCDKGYSFVVKEKQLANGNTLKSLVAIKA